MVMVGVATRVGVVHVRMGVAHVRVGVAHVRVGMWKHTQRKNIIQEHPFLKDKKFTADITLPAHAFSSPLTQTAALLWSDQTLV